MSWYNLDNIIIIIECLAFVVKSCPKTLTHNSRFTRKTASIKPGMLKTWIILISCAHPQADQRIKCVTVRLQKIAETFLLLPSPNSLVDGFVSNLTPCYYIWLYGYRYIRAFYEPGREKYLCIYNHLTKYNSQVLQQAAAIQSNMQTRFQTEWFYIIYSRCVPYFSKHVSYVWLNVRSPWSLIAANTVK